MDGYIRGLKHEAEQMLTDVDEAKERGRRELDDIDRQIIELVRKKDEQKTKIDKRVRALKDQADAKLDMYHKVAGTTPSHRRNEQVSMPASVVAPMKESLFSKVSESEAEAEEDATYYPSKAAKKRHLVNSPEHDHEHDTPRKAVRRDVKSQSRASGPIRSSGYLIDIENYPIIVQHPKDKNTWIQIFCPICKGNMRGDGRWFKGVMGAKRHIRLAHKAISTMTPNKILFGAHEVERLIERSFTLSELDDLRNGRIPAPVSRQGTSETLDESFDIKDNVMVAYIQFPKYPVIIRRADGEWVELRCPDCGGNCVNGKYFDGVGAFRKHLERDHGHDVPFDEDPAEWAVQQCETRKLTEDECMALLEDREDAEPPERIDIEVPDPEDGDDEEGELLREESFEDDVVPKPRSQKRRARSTHDMFKEDSDDLGEHTPKRIKRESMSNGRQNQTMTSSYPRTAASPLSVRTTKDFRRSQYDTLTREDDLAIVQADRPSTAQEHRPSTAQEYRPSTAQQDPPSPTHKNQQQSKDIVTTTIAHRSVGVKSWSDCCPCTLEGHECLNNKCTKAKVCMQLDHSKNCRLGATHTFTPLCMMFTLGSACDADTCAFSHDGELKTALENHDCDEH
ncbi:Purine permease [Venturia nashicola]|uniref:Purine permease n=1 Tax=Venturia nashicola TaxID=86259 RepID=A0A4Z1PM79_9PEZI|nr:Purine permease [Venturia nashicola]TLD36287.1 Purine permease [Venturia nashicola]